MFRTAVLLCCVGLPVGTVLAQSSQPNIIHIFADDLAWGSVGFNNNQTYLLTPNLDALASGGMILNRSYASTVCSPSRANLMTGTHNGHAANDRNGNIGAGLRAEDVTVGEVMQGAGYNTAIMGKWGWGASGTRTIGTGSDPQPTLGNDPDGDLPNRQGFDQFYGYLNHGAAHDFYYDWAWQTDTNGNMVLTPNNGRAGGGPEYLQDVVNRQSEQYIRDRAGDGQPFYLQLNYTAPHFDIDAVTSAPALTDLDGNVFAPAGKGVFNSDPNLDDKQEAYAATIYRMDASVGAIISRLQDPDGDGQFDDSILDNTLIIFSSDNGATPEDGMGSSRINTQAIQGGLRGGKRDLFEGGIRMPAFAYWNGTITAGTSTDLLNDLADVQATAAELAGTHARVGIDGVSILPTLTGEGIQRDRSYLIFENYEASQLGNPNTRWTIIRGNQKLIELSDGSQRLYDLASDPNENNQLNLGIAANEALRAELEAIALAEGVEQGDSYATSYRDWAGSDGANVIDAANWVVTSVGSPGGSPDETWSALLAGAAASDETATIGIGQQIQTLGVEVRGMGHRQTLVIGQGGELYGRNEVRINHQGRVVLQDATVQSVRWIDVLPGGELTGDGTLVGDLYHQGRIDPGLPADVEVIGSAPPPDSFTETPSSLMVFDFTGVQDNNAGNTPTGTPLTQTSTLDPALEIVTGLTLGPGLAFREPANGIDGTDKGDEYNVNGFATGNLASAISTNAYLGYTIRPVSGLEMLVDEVSFSFWRNGENAPADYAILTSIDGFEAGDALATTTIQHAGEGGPDENSPATLTADYTGGQWVSEVEVRLYGYNAGSTSGNTHLTATSISGHFRLGNGGGGPQPTFDLTGKLALEGNFYQLPGSELHVDLGGTDNADPLNPQFDQLVVSLDANLSGKLSIALVDDFAPAEGDTFAVVQAGQLSGKYEQIEGMVLGNGLVLVPKYAEAALTLEAVKQGDANADDAVDQDDLALLLNHWGQRVNAGDVLSGEWTGDGRVDSLDLNLLLRGWTSETAPSFSVPEPGSLSVTLVGGGLLMMRPGKR